MNPRILAALSLGAAALVGGSVALSLAASSFDDPTLDRVSVYRSDTGGCRADALYIFEPAGDEAKRVLATATRLVTLEVPCTALALPAGAKTVAAHGWPEADVALPVARRVTP